MGLFIAGDDQQAGGVLVQAVDDARPVRMLAAGDLAAQQSVDQGAAV